MKGEASMGTITADCAPLAGYIFAATRVLRNRGKFVSIYLNKYKYLNK